MALPLIIGGIALLTGGAFIGSQIDDAIEQPPANTPISGQSIATTSNVVKLVALSGVAWIALRIAKEVKLV